MGEGKPLLGYGLTETNAVGCGIINENYLAKPMSTGPASKPLVDLAILDDRGEPLPQGQVGEVCIRSICNFEGYWNNPEATKAAFFANGYFRTGDLGRSEEHTSELQSLMRISYAVFCLKKKKTTTTEKTYH